MAAGDKCRCPDPIRPEAVAVLPGTHRQKHRLHHPPRRNPGGQLQAFGEGGEKLAHANDCGADDERTEAVGYNLCETANSASCSSSPQARSVNWRDVSPVTAIVISSRSSGREAATLSAHSMRVMPPAEKYSCGPRRWNSSSPASL